MDKILSLPPNLVSSFNDVAGLPSNEWFPTTDPNGVKVGSGGGTAWALKEHCKDKNMPYAQYLQSGKRIIIHAGGQSRRLPAYAPSGKVLAPVPIFRWGRGQAIDQNLLSLQMPLYERLMLQSAANQNTLIASGDVYIHVPTMPDEMPEADVVCYAIWTSPQLASNHGVFFTRRTEPQKLDFMLQKPSHDEIERLSATHLFLMDIGVWVLSDKAVDVLMRKCGWNGEAFVNGTPDYYDLYSSFGTALGEMPSETDADIAQLSVAIVTLSDGEFYHYGTSPELISSTERVQNRIVDQRNIWHKKVKPSASIFVQNADCRCGFGTHNRNVWIENSTVGSGWSVTESNIITGVPANDWTIAFASGECIDVVPIDDDKYCLRPYSISDKFRGALSAEATTFMGVPFAQWLSVRSLSMAAAGLADDTDIQAARIFPVLSLDELTQDIVGWMLHADGDCSAQWLAAERLSADEISARANLRRLVSQRKEYLKQNLPVLAQNYNKSVFYQSDLRRMAALFRECGVALPQPLPADEDMMTRMRDHMFRSEMLGSDGAAESEAAFGVLRQIILSTAGSKVQPVSTVQSDQIVWGRSPARLDVAGGWADTPPYCLQEGGSVVNMAVELNGQPPIQVYIRMSENYNVVMRSIDNGVMETVSSYDELAAYDSVGSAFSIPKAALCLAGFHPDFCLTRYASLEEQLRAFGGGLEITLLVAIPKGSGLGTSSILASTLLGTLSDLCGLNWDKQSICHKTLVLEQLLTTGGGWQDQYGGIYSGIKLLETQPGAQNSMSAKWLPENLFSMSPYKECWLLYYTGVTRVAKNILADIVRGMFLNESERLETLDAIKRHAYAMADAIQRGDFAKVGKHLRRSWQLNCKLDPGTTTPDVERIVEQIDHLAAGYKLLGAGGGGYMLICASSPENALAIRKVLNTNPPNAKARFVEMSVSSTGLQISRS